MIKIMKMNISRMVKGLIPMGILSLVLMFPAVISAQSNAGNMRTISGTVVDAATGNAMSGVTVQAYGNSGYTATTDGSGAYSISIPSGVDMLSFLRSGFVTVNSPISHLGEPVVMWKGNSGGASAPVSGGMRTVTGTVYDGAFGTPMPGVRIQAYNNGLHAAMTKEDGTYSIQVPDYITSLTFMVDGCNNTVSSIAGKSGPVDVLMFPEKFSELYATKTDATISKKSLVSSMNADLSVDQQIQSGLLGDVRAITRSGQLGAGVDLLVSGINSLNINTQPLFVIDGVIMDVQSTRETIHDGYFNNILSNLMVDDIESVTVLKNGLAIYGSKGANGVILIDTKRNHSMATRIDVSLAGNYQLMPKYPDMMNASQYRSYVSELLGTTTAEVSDDYKFLQLDPNYYYYNTYHNDTDWGKEAYRNAFVQSYSINVDGGDDIAKYNLSVGFANGNATLKSNDYQRFNLRLNSDIILGNKVSVRFDASYSDVTRDLRDDGVPSDVDDATITAPAFLSLIKSPFLTAYSYDINKQPSPFLAKNDDYLEEVLGEDVSLANPVSILQNGEGTNKNYLGSRLINIAITPKISINRFWSISEHFSYTMTSVDENYYIPIFGTPSFKVAGVGEVDNKVAAMSSQQSAFMSNTYFNFDKRVKASNWHVSAGFRWISNVYKQNSMLGYNSGNDKTPNMSTNLQYKSTAGIDDKDVSLTWWAQGNYSFRERYYIYAGLGLSASSRFGGDVSNGLKLAGVPWGIFPSAAFSWVMSSEPWFKARFINYLKLNAAFDLTGNDGFNDTASRTYFSPIHILGESGASGLSMANIGNSTLQWETTTRYSAGLDINLFKNYLSISANAFLSYTNNLLSISRLSYMTGIEDSWSNGGSLKNIGFDVSAILKLVNHKNFAWEAGLSVGKYKNELTSLPDNDRAFNTNIYGANVRSMVGEPVGIFWGYKTDGVFSTTTEANAANLYMKAVTGQDMPFEAGDVKFVNTYTADDVNGKHYINEKDMVKIGDPNPKLFGHIYTKASFKGLTLSATFTYSWGNDVFNYQRMILESGSRFNNQTVAMVNRWTCEGQVTQIPSANYGDPMQNARFSDRWIEDGSYLRLKNVTLSYKLPVRNNIIQGITIWGAANNLFTLTKYLGADPEFSLSNNILTQGIDRGLLPQSRNFSIGLKINL